VDFPVRGPEDQHPILTPPYQPPSAAGQRRTGGTLGGAALAEAGWIPQADQVGRVIGSYLHCPQPSVPPLIILHITM